MKKRMKGFTMIELLIVIAVLGILAVAVLAAINPIEQINRGKDTGSRSDAEQLISGIERFYATKGYYPWQVSATDTNSALSWGVMNSGNSAILNNLSTATGELKYAFITRITKPDYNSIYLYNRGTLGDSTYACFSPNSKAFDDEAVLRCSGGLPTDLQPQSGTVCAGVGNTYSCLP